MQLPFFYHQHIEENATQIVLTEETSKHCVQVLRMQNGEKLKLTNGLGIIVIVQIVEAHKKNTIVNIIEKTQHTPQHYSITIAISLLKNSSRFEWFLEKATEIGVTQIIPLLCNRTEKQSFKFDRLNNILISAMLQSQQAFLPILHQPILYQHLFKNNAANYSTTLIAHCIDNDKLFLQNIALTGNTIILIGPEGDFTTQEIEQALQQNFTAVSLGNTRLRSETAGIVAATLLVNKFA